MKQMSPIPSVVIGLLVLVPAWTLAQSDPVDRFSVSLGAFITDRNTSTRLDSATLGTGTGIDLEEDLGLDSSDSVVRLDGHYRFNQKHRVNFSVFDLSRDSSAAVQRDIQYGDRVFLLDTVVNANFDLTIYKLAYTYSVMQRDNGYLGVTLGAYIADSKIGLAEQSLGQVEVREITAPLPVVGLRGEHRFSEKWSLRASGEVFALEYGDFKGSLYDLYVGLDYQLFDRMAIGAGFNSVRMDIGVTKENASGDLDWQYDGGLLFIKFEF